MGAHDLELAAIALARGATLVTHDVTEFVKVPALPSEEWAERNGWEFSLPIHDV